MNNSFENYLDESLKVFNDNKIIDAMKAHIEKEPLAKIDYVSAVDGVTMATISELKGEVLVAMAVYIGKTRLIDNFICNV